MGKVIGLGAGTSEIPQVSLATLRVISGMDPEEFAVAVGQEADEPVPTFVYLSWEGGEPAPRAIYNAARRVAERNGLHLCPKDRAPRVTRRGFLGGLSGLAALAAAGLPGEPLAVPLRVGDGGRRRRVSLGTTQDLAFLVDDYRRSYASSRSVGDLLPFSRGLMTFLIDLGRRGQWPSGAVSLASLVGQLGALTGLLTLMGPRDLRAAEVSYRLALGASKEAEDWDLAAYVLGSLAFQAVSDSRPRDGRAIVDAAWQLASARAAPRTRAWAASLASEIYARDGEESRSGRLMEAAWRAIDGTRSTPSWKGIGWFDEAKLSGYEGGNLALLGRYGDAEQHLRRALRSLDHARVKHRSTSTVDLALVLVARKDADVDQVCGHAMEGLDLALQIGHQESVERVVRVQFQLRRWRTHPAVRQLAERLQAAAP